MRQPPSYFESTYFDLAWYQFRFLNQFATIAPDAPAPTGSGLTIHLPDGTLAKGLTFLGRTDDGGTLRSDWQAVVWDHAEPTGLRLDALPDSLDAIKLQRVPVWNASGTSQDVTVTSTISTMRDGTPTTVYTQSTPYTLGAHGRVLHEEEVDWTDLRPPETQFTWRTDLIDGSGQRVGGFEVDFTHEAAPPFDDRFERSWTAYIPYPSETATAHLVVSGGEGVLLDRETLSGGILQAVLRVPTPETTTQYTVRLWLTDMTGPIETMGWEIVDATGSHRHIHGGEIDVTRTVLVGKDTVGPGGRRAFVHIYATTAESHGESLAFIFFQ
jgi:predicted RNA binding protein YcfA (HicA-like mRNA interferase family)